MMMIIMKIRMTMLMELCEYVHSESYLRNVMFSNINLCLFHGLFLFKGVECFGSLLTKMVDIS
jgi:hypothetical protein